MVVTEGRRGTFVSGATTPPAAVRASAEELVRTARRVGMGLPEAQRLVEQAWGDQSAGR